MKANRLEGLDKQSWSEFDVSWIWVGHFPFRQIMSWRTTKK